MIYPLNLQWQTTQLKVSPNRVLPHQNGQVPTQLVETADKNGHEGITLKSCSRPNAGVTRDAYRIWRERNPNERPNLTDNALINQRRFIEKQKKANRNRAS